MRDLLMLLVRNGGLMLFLLLEGLCFFLIVQFNDKQEEILYSSANTISGYFYTQFDEVAKYYNLSSVADTLARENARLYSQLEDARLIRSPWRDTMKRADTLDWYAYIPAQVRSNTINAHNNHLLIDVGRKHGVKRGMGVISNNGIVGIVKNTQENFSSVMSILHRECRVSVAIKRNQYFGFLVWNSMNPLEASLVDMPKHANVRQADTIVTSGYSTVFPEGIMVGTVNKFNLQAGSNSWDIDIRLNNDLGNIKYVYVLDNLLKEELKELEEAASDE